MPSFRAAEVRRFVLLIAGCVVWQNARLHADASQRYTIRRGGHAASNRCNEASIVAKIIFTGWPDHRHSIRGEIT